jgi:hypothetical protein
MSFEFKDFEFIRKHERFVGTNFYLSHWCFCYRVNVKDEIYEYKIWIPKIKEYEFGWEVCTHDNPNEIFGWEPLPNQPNFNELPKWFQDFVTMAKKIVELSYS